MTAAEALERQIEGYRRMTGEQRLAIALDFADISRLIAFQVFHRAGAIGVRLFSWAQCVPAKTMAGKYQDRGLDRGVALAGLGRHAGSHLVLAVADQTAAAPRPPVRWP
jgi:hypothetical protein